MEQIKNRERAKYTFANINLFGKCNANCFFCLGKDMKQLISRYNHTDTHYTQWSNFEIFLDKCTKAGIKKLYVTGQSADGLQYKYLSELVDDLQDRGFVIGVRTNGFNAFQKLSAIRKMKGGIGLSIHSLTAYGNKRIMGTPRLPHWDKIIPACGDNTRVSIVVNRFNIKEIDSLLAYVSKFDNVRYIQLRRVLTDTRVSLLQEDIDAFETYYQNFILSHKPYRFFYKAPVFKIYGKDILFWKTVETSVNSLNYFTDGTCSNEYFIVEGYLNNLQRERRG